MSTLAARRLSLAGIRVDALERDDLIELLRQATISNDKLLILHHNLHSLYLHETSRPVREFYARASWVYIDGMPVVWLGRALGLEVAGCHRVTFLDSFSDILDQASKYGWRVFYLGSADEVVANALPILRAKHPQLIIGAHHGFFAKDTGSAAVIDEINGFGADVLFVGMGMPTQELWLAEHQAKINACAILTSGATLDYVTGHAYRPPKWAGSLGLYGIFRLLADPKRLWRRYLVEPFFLFMHLVRRFEWPRLPGL